LWTDELRVKLIAQNGSVQRLDLPEDLKELYKTAARPAISLWGCEQFELADLGKPKMGG